MNNGAPKFALEVDQDALWISVLFIGMAGWRRKRIGFRQRSGRIEEVLPTVEKQGEQAFYFGSWTQLDSVNRGEIDAFIIIDRWRFVL